MEHARTCKNYRNMQEAGENWGGSSKNRKDQAGTGEGTRNNREGPGKSRWEQGCNRGGALKKQNWKEAGKNNEGEGKEHKRTGREQERSRTAQGRNQQELGRPSGEQGGNSKEHGRITRKEQARSAKEPGGTGKA